MSYNLDLKGPQIIPSDAQEFNFLWLHLTYLKNTFQEIFKKRFINSAVIQMISYTSNSG